MPNNAIGTQSSDFMGGKLPEPPLEPIRTLHHFACSGGTIISKCIAVMPNVQLLSEIDPLSNIQVGNNSKEFAPTDLLLQLRQSSRGVDNKTLIRYFVDQISNIYQESSSIGQRLVLRDHAHSMFCSGKKVEDRPTLKEILETLGPICSAVTVRHPIDSYLSLQANKWIQFQPETLDEYCSRYLSFLKRHQGIPILKYEDFCNDPKQIVAELCKHLIIPYRDDFLELFDAIRLTGDSGRKSNEIVLRERRDEYFEMKGEAEKSQNFTELCQFLEYQ